MPKYKESKSRSCVLKMPSCFPCAPQELACLEQTTVRGMQFWQYRWQCTSSPSVANSTQKFPLWDKVERGSIPFAVSHSWIKSVLLLWCRLSSSHTFIRLKWLAWTQAIFIIAYLNQHFRRSGTLKSTEYHKSWTEEMLPYWWEWKRCFPQYNDK